MATCHCGWLGILRLLFFRREGLGCPPLTGDTSSREESVRQWQYQPSRRNLLKRQHKIHCSTGDERLFGLADNDAGVFHPGQWCGLATRRGVLSKALPSPEPCESTDVQKTCTRDWLQMIDISRREAALNASAAGLLRRGQCPASRRALARNNPKQCWPDTVPARGGDRAHPRRSIE